MGTSWRYDDTGSHLCSILTFYCTECMAYNYEYYFCTASRWIMSTSAASTSITMIVCLVLLIPAIPTYLSQAPLGITACLVAYPTADLHCQHG